MSYDLQELLVLMQTPTLPELGPGPRDGVSTLSELDKSLTRVTGRSALSHPAEQLIRATIYLWHDHLDESHSIAQGIENREGSLIHGVMHRREPDYGNAKYWFHRVGDHSSFPALAKRAAPILCKVPDLQKRLTPSGRWNPMAFIDECEKAARHNPWAELLREIQATELRLLLEHLVRGF